MIGVQDPNVGKLAIVAYGVAVLGMHRSLAAAVADEIIVVGEPVPSYEQIHHALLDATL
jgi:hypothetical protein